LNLADVYSYLESLRRGTTGLLSNPSDTLNQWGSQIKEDLGKYDQGNARTMGLLSDPVLGGGSAPGASAWQNNGPLGSGLLGALHIAYHGTPHTVDKFDMTKVGTGEGAQAYGHGLYFAENPNVAQIYKDALSRSEIVGKDGKVLYSPPAKIDYHGTPEGRAMSALQYAHDAQSVDPYPFARNVLRRTDDKEAADAALGLLGQWQDAGGVPKPSGNLYKVDINADPAHYLDWDKPLSEQSQHVQDAVSPLLTVNFAKSNPIGSEIYHGFGPSGYEPAGTATKDMATQALRQAGIPGIKYKDAGSRNNVPWKLIPANESVSGKWVLKQGPFGDPQYFTDAAQAQAAFAAKQAENQATHNYVVFDDSLINNLGPWQP
jgi:hypothetical protein